MVYGKEFGFSTGKLEKEKMDLKNVNQGLLELASKFKAQRDGARSDVEKYKSQAAALESQLQQQAKQAETTWFPVDDIEFLLNKRYEAREASSKSGRKWSAQDVELTLEAVEVSDRDLILATNLDPPANRLRINLAQSSWSIPMARWEYKLTLVDFDYQVGVQVRLERRKISARG